MSIYWYGGRERISERVSRYPDPYTVIFKLYTTSWQLKTGAQKSLNQWFPNCIIVPEGVTMNSEECHGMCPGASSSWLSWPPGSAPNSQQCPSFWLFWVPSWILWESCKTLHNKMAAPRQPGEKRPPQKKGTVTSVSLRISALHVSRTAAHISLDPAHY